MYIQRNIEQAIKLYAKKFPVLAITGPRQSGKTTLLKNVFPDYQYVSLENPEIRQMAEQDPNGFLGNFDRYVIIDEAQRVPHLFNYLQTKIDNDQIMGQYILSGSQNFLLIEKITQSLAGRLALFKLLPFDFSELKAQNLLPQQFTSAILKGFYPMLYSRDVAPDEYYPNYLETYIERDVRSILNIQNLNLFRNFIRLCAGRVGQLLNYSNLANDCGISPKTAQLWITILEASYIIFQLPPYFKNINTRLTKSTKLYFWDTGLVANLLGIKTDNQVDSHYARGSLFENLVVSNFLKEDFHQVKRQNFFFYRDSNQNEIDLMIERENGFEIIEIKSSQTLSSDFFKGIQHFEKHFPDLIAEKKLIYGGDSFKEMYKTRVINWRGID